MSVPAPGPASELARSRAALRALAAGLRRGGGDRRRSAWAASAIGGAGAFGCVAASIAALTLSDPAPVCYPDTVQQDGGGTIAVQTCASSWHVGGGLARYLAEPGLRTGVLVGALVLAVPFLVLTVQALRFGEAGRERRLAALVVAGAGRAELRRLGAIDGARDAIAGTVLALVGYLVLWATLGPALPVGSRMMPPDPVPGLIAWPFVAVALVGFAAIAGAAAARPARLSPTGLTRREPRPLRTAEWLIPCVLGTALVLVLLASLSGLLRTRAVVPVVLILVLVTSATAGTPLAALRGRMLVRRAAPVQVLTGRRLLADPRTPGRAGGVLFGVGFAVTVEIYGIQEALLMTQEEVVNGVRQVTRTGTVDGFYLTGWGLALAATLFAAAVAVASLTIGAAEQIRDSARPTAALVAAGAELSDVRAAVRAWLRAAATVPAAVGALAAAGLISSVMYLAANSLSPVLAGEVVATGLAGVVASAVLAQTGAAVAARLLRDRIDASASIENLRTG